MSLRA